AVAQKHASLSRFDPRSKSNGGKTRALPKGDNLTPCHLQTTKAAHGNWAPQIIRRE
ncbi:hypothetical protein BaRGS_00032672, partial [Batillaria attramentaria]